MINRGNLPYICIMKTILSLTLTLVLVLALSKTAFAPVGFWTPVIRIETDNTSCRAEMVLRWWERGSHEAPSSTLLRRTRRPVHPLRHPGSDRHGSFFNLEFLQSTKHPGASSDRGGGS